VSHDENPRDGDVRISDYAGRVVRRWYIVVLCIVAAIGLVVLNTVGNDTKFQAQATVFLGQPLTPGGGQTITATASTNPTSASAFVRSDPVIEKAAQAAGLKPAALRSHVSVTPQTTNTAVKTSGSANILITIRGPKTWTRDQMKKAVASLADQLVEWSNTYQDAKVRLLGEQVTTDKDTIATLQRSITRAEKSLSVLERSQLSPVDKASTSAALLSTIADAGSRIDEISLQMTTNQIYLTAASTVEAAGYVQQPAVKTITAAGRQSSLLVAAFAGLIAGIILALLWDAIRRPRSAA
jgi:hypothetical protein